MMKLIFPVGIQIMQIVSIFLDEGGGPADWILPGGLTDLKNIGLNLK